MQAFYAKDSSGVKIDSEIHKSMVATAERSWAGSQAKEDTIKRAVDLFGIPKEVAELIYK